jgi:dipeptidyl aminopeptidase/acylaminoacyl peptidase
MKRIFLALSALIAGMCLNAAIEAASPPENPALTKVIESLYKPSKFSDVRISPDGTYLAATVMLDEDHGALAILRRSDMKLTGTFKMSDRDLVDEFEWVSNERILLSIAESDGSRDTPTPTGEIYGVNFDGSEARLLAGGRNDIKVQRSHGGVQFEWALLIDTLRDDDDHVLVYILPAGNSKGALSRIERMHVMTGKRKVLSRSPVVNASFLVDDQQRVRFAWGLDESFEHSLYYRDNNEAEWRRVPDPDGLHGYQYAIGMSGDGTLAYLQVQQKSGPDELVSWNTATNERKLMLRHESVDPADLFYSTDGRQLLGVGYLNGRPEFKFFKRDHPDTDLLRTLMQSFPGELVRIENATKDGALVVYSVNSDRNPGEFYVHDRRRGKSQFLLARRPWIDPDQMAEMRPISYKARDGQTIHGFLTVPPGSDGKKLPLILNPHGGPIGVFDSWSFNSEVQLLASQGYAVLQVNYRGSGNYGRDFQVQGHRQWGGRMIDDQTDAARWAITTGIADADRICIYGASYGGYAAMMGAAREPDLYRCAVGYIGVYDLPRMAKYDIVGDISRTRAYLERTLGADKAFLEEISPVGLADKIKVPVFLAAGGEDWRAPKAHSVAMRKALQRADNEPEWMLAPHEGHGFYRLNINIEYYQRLLAFFDRHIGKDSAAAASK